MKTDGVIVAADVPHHGATENDASCAAAIEAAKARLECLPLGGATECLAFTPLPFHGLW